MGKLMQALSWHRYRHTTIKHGSDTWAGFHVCPLPFSPLFIISASNPYGKKLSAEDNTSRHHALLAAIAAMAPWAVAIEVMGEKEQWKEHCWAVAGISLEHALALARSFEQEAIFELTHAQQRLIGADGAVLDQWPRDRLLA